MIVRLKLDFEPSDKEKKYIRAHLGHMRFSKEITILDTYFLKFLHIASFKNEDELNRAEKESLVRKIIASILVNREALLNLIMPNISHLYSILSSLIIEDLSKEVHYPITEVVIEEVAKILKEDENERKRFIENVWDFGPLSCLKLNYLTKIVQALIDSKDLSRLFENNDDLCAMGKLLPPSLCSLIIREFYKPENESLRKKLITSREEFIKTQQCFPFLVRKKKIITTSLSPKEEGMVKNVGIQNEKRDETVCDSNRVLFFSNKGIDSSEGIKNDLSVCDNAVYEEEVLMDEINVSKHLPSSLS